jgi:hypothetical protein
MAASGLYTRSNCNKLQFVVILTAIKCYTDITQRSDTGITNDLGRAMAQAVSHRTLTSEPRVRTRVCQCGIYGEQSGTGKGFFPSSSIFPVTIIPPRLHTHTSSEGQTTGSLVAAVQRHSVTPSP